MRQRPHKENPQEKTKSSSWPTWNPLGSSKTTKSEQITSPLASPYSSEGLVRSEIDLSVIDPELRASGSKSPLSADSRRSVGDSSDWQDDQTMSPISIQDSDFSRKLGDTWDIPTTNGVGKTAKRSGMNGKSINFGEVDVVRGTPSFTASQLDTSDSELAALSNDLGSDITDEEQNDQIVTKSYGSGFPGPVSEEQKAPYFRPDSSSSVVKSTEPSRRAPSLFPSIGVSTALASGNQTPTGTMGPAASGDTASHQPDTLPSAPGENAEVRRGILKGSSYQAPAVPSDHDTSTQSDSEGRKDTRSGSKFTPKPSMNLRTSRSSPSRAESTYHPSRTGPKNRGLAFSKSRDTSRSRKSRGRPSKGMGPKCGVQFTNSSAQSRNPDPYYDSEQMTDDEEEASSVSAVASARRRVLPPSRLKTTGPSKTLRSREVALQKRMEYLPPKNPPLQSDTSPTDWKCSCFWCRTCNGASRVYDGTTNTAHRSYRRGWNTASGAASLARSGFGLGKKCWDSVADYSSYPESRPKFDQGQATPGETDGGTGSHSPARRKKARFGDGVEIAGNGGTNHSPPPIGRKKARFGDGVESAQDIETVGYGGTDRSYSPPRRGTARSDVAIETVGETQFPDSSRRRSPSSSKDTTRLDSSRPSQPPKGRTGFIIPPPPSNTGDAEPHHRGCSCCKCRATEQSEGDSSSDSSEEVGEDTRPQPSMLDILRELRQSFQPHEPASTAPVITTRPTAPEATTRPTGSKYSHVEYTAPPLTDKGWLYSSYGGRRKGLTSRRKSDRYFQSCLSTGLGSDHCLPLVEQHHLNHLPKFKDVCETGTRFDQGKRSWKPKLMKRLLHRVNRRGKIYRQKRDDLDLATTLAEWERTTLYSKYGHENAITAQGSCWNTMKDRLAEAERRNLLITNSHRDRLEPQD